MPCFPYEKQLKSFDISFCPSLTAKNLRQLEELKWVWQIYNLIFLDPPGVEKTHPALALGCRAAQEGYKVSFVTMAGLHEQSSIILTSNKCFEDWRPELFGGTEMVTAALDRLMHHCDVIRMDGKSYRLEHKKTFLEK